ncbi:regulator of Ty1 Transposition, partial [Linderina macrospora]
LPKPTTQFLKGYVVAIDSQLRPLLSEGAIAQLNQRLAEAGATSAQISGQGSDSPAYNWKSVDILICHSRSGYDYSKASRLGKIVGSFVWLYHLFFTEKLVPPTKRLLHYPVPDTAARGMAGMVITTSHYTGASKEYLKKLILAMGAEYTPNMTRRNTHLITAMPEGLKYARAMDWDIHVINHIWLEQSFQRWKALSVSHASFTYFPSLPILNSMVGNTEVNVSKLPVWVDAAAGDSIAESSDLDILSDSELDSEIHVDTKQGASGARNLAVRTSQGHIYPVPADDDAVPPNGNSSDDDDDSNIIPESSDELDTANAKDKQTDPDSVAAGQVRQSSRRAAMAASKSLGQMMKAANIFETEMKREKSHRRSAKRSLASETGIGELGSQTDGAKRARTTPRPKHIVRIMFTQVRPSAGEQQSIIAMGGEIVDTPELATHLVAKKVGKTAKMLEAVASGRIAIVGRAWMDDSLERGRWIPVGPTDDKGCEYGETEKYQLVDTAAESRWNFVLRDSLQRAHKHRMFDGVTVFITPHTVPAMDVLRPLIECAGGQAVEKLTKAKLTTLINQSIHISKSKSEDDERIPPLLVISCAEDKDMWTRFDLSKDKQMPIYGSEVLLVGLLRQRLLRSSTEFLCRHK